MNTTIERLIERLIERAHGQVAVIIRIKDDSRIIIRDNSGVTGLTGDDLMTKCVALMDALFRRGDGPSENTERTHGGPDA